MDVRKGIGEALTGADAGRAIEPLKTQSAEGRHREHGWKAIRDSTISQELSPLPSGRRPRARIEVVYTGTGRSLVWLRDGLSPPHESERSKVGMNRPGKSDRLIVPKKPTNKEGGTPPLAELVEGRSLTKGNSSKQNKVRTQSRERNRNGAP